VQVRSRRVVAVLAVPVVVLTACTSNTSKKSSTSTTKPASTPTATAASVGVSGAFGVAPTVTVPPSAPPPALTQRTLVAGAGQTVAKGDTLVLNYLGQTWAPQSGKPHVFDSTFSQGAPTAFVIGTGKVIAGWDKVLVGKRLGSRVLMTVPPADGFGSSGQPSAGISPTDTLVFVIDLLAAYKANASAPGTPVANLPTRGLPKITNVAGAEPTIVSTAGVKAPRAPTSTLVVSGRGPKIDVARTLVVQFVQADLATGKGAHATWGQGPQVAPAKNVLHIADKLTGQRVGSRVIVLLPATAATPASGTQAAQRATAPQVLVIDVVGQF
jgi:peptidylprolyl isomerase